MKKTDRNGEEKYNNEKCLMKIIEYNNCDDIIIEFEDKYKAKVRSTYANFKNGEIKNPYYKSVFNMGYIGEGNYTPSICGKLTIQYKTWNNMLARCYDDKYQEKNPTYKDCKVCEEWYDFQNFALWFDENYYTIDDEKMCLDKDILIKGNKIYSSETCIFVSNRINTLFVKSDKTRGKCLIGVTENGKYFMAQLSCVIDNYRITKYLGNYTAKKEAFEAYKKAKEEYIKEVAEEYREKIPQKLYDVMYNYEVAIDD